MKDMTIKSTLLPSLERRGITPDAFRVAKTTIFPNASSDEVILLAFDYCKARNLDIMKRVIHIVPIWDSKQGKMVEGIWPGISEIRTTAARTGQYAGKDSPEFGQLMTKKIGSLEVTFPEWCSITVYKMVNGQRCAFRGNPVYWEETYASRKNNDVTPNAMWAKRARGQLIKCAEAAALREAFPEEIGSELCAEEMEGKVINVDDSKESAASVNKNPDLVSRFTEAEVVDVTLKTPLTSEDLPEGYQPDLVEAINKQGAA